jgi:Cu-Zn family superoxide dismutase
MSFVRVKYEAEMKRKALLLLSTLVILACSEQGGKRQAPATGNGPATLKPPPDVSGTPIVDHTGKQVGMVAARLEKDRVAVSVDTVGLARGLHGVHIHQVPKCEPPTFESAGAHWNWTDKKHGHKNPQGNHAGDLGNLTVGADGKGRATFLVPLKDWDPKQMGGLPVVIHASADDDMTDPSGNSGARIACGVVYLRRD